MTANGTTNGNGAARKSIRAPNPPLKDSVFDMFRLDGKTAIITGGSGGIGYEVARALAEAGANVSEITSNSFLLCLMKCEYRLQYGMRLPRKPTHSLRPSRPISTSRQKPTKSQ